ncbi:preprotein translocase subunit SecA [Candidatus Fermentibacteria bacterium]|nr:MAG: preprotein translocase subunit SecA [Candidatus Fermentibacteria bacterium]
MGRLGNLFRKLMGDNQAKLMKSLNPVVEQINETFKGLAELSDEQLKGKTDEFRRRLLRGETVDDLMVEAFAVVKEVCRRNIGEKWDVTGHTETWNMVPYDVQLKGGIVLHRGMITEMATGEGKTLVAVLPVYLNGLRINREWEEKARETFGEDTDQWEFRELDGVPVGAGAHLVTVNDYLALRDSLWMGPIYNYLGLSIGCIQGGMTPDQRRAQYNCDITYGTNNEFGFDYLRDNMAVRLEQRVHRGYVYAIVDEVDSVLIDEARTPLIISGPVARNRNRYMEYRSTVASLVRKQSKIVNDIVADANELWSSGDHHGAATLYLKARRGAPKHNRLSKALRDPDIAAAVKRVEGERLREKNIHELDEGLCFSIDEKERSVSVSDMGRKLLSPDDPDFFLIRDIGDVMAELEARDITEEEKFEQRKKVYEDHSSRAEALHNIDQLLKAYQLYEKDVEYIISEGRVVIVDQFTGRPMPGRRFSDGLHEALEAKENVEIRNETQTLATITIQNYFRMYEKLAGMTGTAETEEEEFGSIYDVNVAVVPTNRPIARIDHEDRVYASKREKYAAIIQEIAERHATGQPVLVGTVSVEVSELLAKLLKRQKIIPNVLNAKHHMQEAEIVSRAGQRGAVTIATNMAGRGTDIKLTDEVKELGGLFVIGTERHESRRIDRQLRGRSGRQGDPGGSRFYLSLEDDLFRLFASEKIIDFLKKSQEKEGAPIEHPLLTKSIEQAQKRVEQYHFGIRKHLLEYDDVANRQREVIYRRRLQALTGEGLEEEVLEMISAVADYSLTEAVPDGSERHQWNMERVPLILRDLSGAVFNITGPSEKIRDPGQLRESLCKMVLNYFEKKREKLGDKMITDLEKWSVLSAIDARWRDHLYALDHLKSGIGLRAYAQRDPLVEYKKEAFGLFEELLDAIDKQAVRQILSLWPAKTLQRQQGPAGRAVHPGLQRPGGSGVSDPRAGAGRNAQGKQQTVKRTEKKVGRNDPCPCGSGKKYKQCCGS